MPLGMKTSSNDIVCHWRRSELRLRALTMSQNPSVAPTKKGTTPRKDCLQTSPETIAARMNPPAIPRSFRSVPFRSRIGS